MASGLLFNPIRLLQVAPFASSTGTLVHATVELVTNSAFLLPSIRTQSDAIVPAWYETVFGKGVLSVLLLNLTTISTAAANLYLHRQRGGLQTTRFYWMGLVGAIGHLAFIPFVAGPVQRIIENKRYRESKGRRQMRRTRLLGRWPSGWRFTEYECWWRICRPGSLSWGLY